MNEAKYAKFFELLHELVDDYRPYVEKRNELLTNASQDDMVNLEEFASWFPLGP